MIDAGARADVTGLAALAARHGVETSYRGLDGQTRRASPDALVAALRALGASLDEADAAPSPPPLLEPVTVVWSGAPAASVPVPSAGAVRLECRLETEEGDKREWTCAAGPIALPDDLPLGYHDLTVTAGERVATTRVIHAPATLHDAPGRDWGVFLPLYALRTAGDLVVSDWTGLEALAEWTGALGGAAVGTLPLLAAFLDDPFDPSPYAPVSRLFWNELYLDPERSPELAGSPEARALLESDALRDGLAALAEAPLVDYREAARLKRRVVEALARTFDARAGWTSDEFRGFLRESPEAATYAAFRAAGERCRAPWREWPARMRDGAIEAGDYAEEDARTHLYAQWLSWRQSAAAARAAAAAGAGLYLDLPLGVHPDGFDTWRFRELFATGVSTGAPPDDFFAGGQDWGFPPLHPRRIREDGYRYVVAGLRTAMRRAAVVRLDHVMALHRLYWVPHGLDATEGVYVRYHPEEWWAILCLESRRHATPVVGEDLGTVPHEVREAMDRRGARRMYVLPFELERDGEPRLSPVPERAVASVGTHDMPPFAAWWEAAGEAGRAALEAALAGAGPPPEGAPDDRPDGEGTRARRALAGAHAWLARSAARLVLVNLEDLWLEDRSQNEPGTTMDERPNWRRRARLSFDEFRERPDVVGALETIDSIRKEGGGS
ncbi:MAG TPA: 4-alpha-glucanotransferase [Gemmatimonadota bacterium]|nr:4-alpha-glucanotransferase [Gemmatimonadota bacterium]